MHQSNSFVKKTAKGKVLKVVREHYLRDDIFSGTELDPACDPESYKLSPAAKHYLLIDTNVALHQASGRWGMQTAAGSLMIPPPFCSD